MFNTFTRQIKGKYHCINEILHWLWNVDNIWTDISAYILLRHSMNLLNCLMAKMKLLHSMYSYLPGCHPHTIVLHRDYTYIINQLVRYCSAHRFCPTAI